MARKYASGKFTPKHAEKYVGKKSPTYRSSWEFHFMKFCDENPAIQAWASEAVKIPYRNPLTGRHTIYVPDFFIQYKTKKGKNMVELIEVKPDNQTTMENAGKSKHNQAHAILNAAKWEAARAYCKSKGISFRVITEKDMFHQGKR
jgi:hypothetical protein|tara:strand:- start:1815 stop:2252 length:438 start_codon:yes stop_codon:yes gene_type:complete